MILMGRLKDLLVIVGPTASGKSRLGLGLAGALGGEIISADAFAVYRGMDIGTDKPGREDRRKIRHHLIDILNPDQLYSAGDFARRASVLIQEIQASGRTPIIVGGTHFYIEALVKGLCPTPPREDEIRKKLEDAWKENPEALRRQLRTVDPESAARIPAADRQRILRALEVHEITGESLSEHWRKQDRQPAYHPLYLSPLRAREELYDRINTRVDAMFAGGFVAEVQALLGAGFSPDSHAFKAIGYREIVQMIESGSKLREVIEAVKRSSRRLAKRQITWLRHHQESDLHHLSTDQRGIEEGLRLWKTFRDSE